MSGRNRFLLFLVSAQNDFIATEDEFMRNNFDPGHRQSSLWVGSSDSGKSALARLRGSGKKGDPDPFFDTTMEIMGPPGHRDDLRVILDEDWHPRYFPEEFVPFGEHCIGGFWGARMPEGLEAIRTQRERVLVLRANSLNVGADPGRYRDVMKAALGNSNPNSVCIGIMGVWTYIKVEYLILNLMTLDPQFKHTQIRVCGDLCAGPHERFHEAALAKFKETLGIGVLDRRDFVAWMSRGQNP